MISTVQAGSAWMGHCFKEIKTNAVKVALMVDKVYQGHKVPIASAITMASVMVTTTSGTEMSKEFCGLGVSVALALLSTIELEFFKRTNCNSTWAAGAVYAGGSLLNTCVGVAKHLTKFF